MFFRSFSSSRKHGRIPMGALERPSNTNLPEKNKLKLSRTRNDHAIIVTLDPNKFAEKKQQRFHLGNHQTFGAQVLLHKQSSSTSGRIFYDRARDRSKPESSPRIPPDTKAFLYYFTSPEKPRIAGELRLRVASSDDPASFESGSDVLLTNGQPWSRPLYTLPEHYSSLYEKLREDQLVPDDLATVLSTFPSSSFKFSYSRRRHLYTLNDTFIVDFSNSLLTFFAITEQGVAMERIGSPFTDGRRMCRARPYTGSALARFERSTLPDHKDTRNVVLRFLKIITPVKCVMPLYDGYICCPKEGDLYRRTRYLEPKPVVWSVNIDKRKGRGLIIRGLQLLWDA